MDADGVANGWIPRPPSVHPLQKARASQGRGMTPWPLEGPTAWDPLLETEGFAAGSRWLSEAMPLVTDPHHPPHPGGVPAQSRPRALASLPGCGGPHSRGSPVVSSLRSSTTGSTLGSLRVHRRWTPGSPWMRPTAPMPRSPFRYPRVLARSLPGDREPPSSLRANLGCSPGPRTAQPEVVGGPEDVVWAQPRERGRPRPPLHAPALRDRSDLRRTSRSRRQPRDAR